MGSEGLGRCGGRRKERLWEVPEPPKPPKSETPVPLRDELMGRASETNHLIIVEGSAEEILSPHHHHRRRRRRKRLMQQVCELQDADTLDHSVKLGRVTLILQARLQPPGFSAPPAKQSKKNQKTKKS